MIDGKFNIVVDERETNRIDYDHLKENISKGMSKSIKSVKEIRRGEHEIN